MIGTDDREETIVSQVEKQSDEIVSYIKKEGSPVRRSEEILEFVSTKIILCADLIEKEKYKNCLYMLIKLNDICLKSILYFPPEIKEEMRAVLKDLEQLIETAEKTKDSFEKPDLAYLLQYLKTFDHPPSNALKINNDITAFYVKVIELLSDIINDIGCIYFSRNKVERSLYYFNLAASILTRMKVYSDSIVVKFVSIVLNLVFAMDSGSNTEELGKILCGTIMLLENVESKTDEQSNKLQSYANYDNSAKRIINLIEVNSKKRVSSQLKHFKSRFTYKLACFYDYYSKILNKAKKVSEAEFASQQSEILLKQLDKQEKLSGTQKPSPEKNSSHLTMDNVQKKFNKVEDSPQSQVDNFSSLSFKTGMTGTTGMSMTTNALAMGKVTKENVIFQKYVEVQGTKFKIIIAHLKEIKSLEIIVYSKPKNLLKKLFIRFQDCLNFASQSEITLSSDKDVQKLLNKIARLLYFKDGELYMKELPYCKTMEDLLRSS